MSLLVSSLKYRTSGLQGNPSEPRSTVQDIYKTLMAEDQPGCLLPAVGAGKLGKGSFGSWRKEHLQVAGWFSDNPSPSFGNGAFEHSSGGTLTTDLHLPGSGTLRELPAEEQPSSCLHTSSSTKAVANSSCAVPVSHNSATVQVCLQS